jgi:hypothetical protein
VKRGGVGATICLSTQAVKMGLEIVGELLALRRQIGKQSLQCMVVDVLRRRAEPAFAVSADFDEVMEHLAFCSFSHRILQLFGKGSRLGLCRLRANDEIARTFENVTCDCFVFGIALVCAAKFSRLRDKFRSPFSPIVRHCSCPGTLYDANPPVRPEACW